MSTSSRQNGNATPNGAGTPSTSKASSKTKKDLYKDVKFFLDSGLTERVQTELHALLISSGATSCRSPFPPGPSPVRRFDENEITHYITNSVDFPEREVLRERGSGSGGANAVREGSKVEIVTPMWVTRSFDLQDLQSGQFYSPDKALFFSGLCICTSELPDLDTAAIHAGVTSLGGQVRKELTREVTHLIVPAPGGTKFEASMKYGPILGMVTVLPHWFEESLKLRQLVPIDLYRFPFPPLLNPSHYISKDSFELRLATYQKTKSNSLASQPTGNTPPPPTGPSGGMTMKILGIGAWEGGAGKEERKAREIGYFKNVAHQYILGLTAPPHSPPSANPAPIASQSIIPPQKSKSQIFSNQKIYLSSDLIGTRIGLEIALKERIEGAGGKCWSWSIDGEKEEGEGKAEGARIKRAKKELEDSTIVVTRLRNGWEFWSAFESLSSSHPKTIGNLTWLYHVLSTSTLESPLDRLLHYPLPHVPVREFAGKKITISNYSGPSRDYVKTLIECLGAIFEGSMSKSTDYVISASDHGAKMKHAKAWGIPIANHLWLENCFLDYTFIPLSSSKIYSSQPSLPGLEILSKDYQSRPPGPGMDLSPMLGLVTVPKESLIKWSGSEEAKKSKEEARLRFLAGGGEDEEFSMEVGEVGREEEIERPLNKFEEDGMQVDGQEGEGDEEVEEENESPVKVDAAAVEDEEGEGEEEEAEEEEEEEEPESPPKRGRGRPPKASTSSSPAKPSPKPKAKPDSKVKGKKVAAKKTPDGDSSDTDVQPVTEKTKGKSKVAPSRRARSSPPPSDDGSDSSSSPPPKNIFTDPVVVTGRRTAALGAAAKLAEQMPDANKFAMEQRCSSGKKKRRESNSQGVGGSSPHRKRQGTEDTDEQSEEEEEEKEKEKEKVAVVGKGKGRAKAKVVTKRMDGDSDEDDEDEEQAKRPAKKLKLAKPTAETQVSSFDNPPNPKNAKKKSNGPAVRILATGLELNKDSPEIKALTRLGAKWTETPSAVTYLVVNALSRTEKFLSCLAYAPNIVTLEWVKQSVKANELLDPEPFLLKDLKREKELGDTLANIVERARQHKLFDGLNLYLTKQILPSQDVLRRIIQSGDGTVHLNVDISTKSNTKKIAEDDSAYIISCIKDKKMWDNLHGKHGKPVFSVEAIFQSVVYQKLLFDDEHRIDPQSEK